MPATQRALSSRHAPDSPLNARAPSRHQELGQIAKAAPTGIEAGPINGDNMLAWEAKIIGDVRPHAPFPDALPPRKHLAAKILHSAPVVGLEAAFTPPLTGTSSVLRAGGHPVGGRHLQAEG
jgi:hypothetical protein